MDKMELPTTLAAARKQFRATKGIVSPDNPDEAPPPELLQIADQTMDIGFVAGVAWLLALIDSARHDKDRHEELPLMLEGLSLELKREAFTREKEVRKELGDEVVDRALKKGRERFSVHGTDDEQQAPSLRDIEETRKAIERMRGQKAKPEGDGPKAASNDHDSAGPSDKDGKDHSNK